MNVELCVRILKLDDNNDFGADNDYNDGNCEIEAKTRPSVDESWIRQTRPEAVAATKITKTNTKENEREMGHMEKERDREKVMEQEKLCDNERN